MTLAGTIVTPPAPALPPFRCPDCHRLLFEGEPGRPMTIKCPRCGRRIVFSLDKPPPTRSR